MLNTAATADRRHLLAARNGARYIEDIAGAGTASRAIKGTRTAISTNVFGCIARWATPAAASSLHLESMRARSTAATPKNGGFSSGRCPTWR
jgi:hypothetical protein